MRGIFTKDRSVIKDNETVNVAQINTGLDKVDVRKVSV